MGNINEFLVRWVIFDKASTISRKLEESQEAGAISKYTVLSDERSK